MNFETSIRERGLKVLAREQQMSLSRQTGDCLESSAISPRLVMPHEPAPKLPFDINCP